MRILERVTRAILSAMKARPTVALQAYEVEVEILARAIEVRDKPKPDDIDSTQPEGIQTNRPNNPQ